MKLNDQKYYAVGLSDIYILQFDNQSECSDAPKNISTECVNYSIINIYI